MVAAGVPAAGGTAGDASDLNGFRRGAKVSSVRAAASLIGPWLSTESIWPCRPGSTSSSSPHAGKERPISILQEQKRDWDELAKTDPLWAVLSDPAKRFGHWDLTEFFDTGEREIEALLRRTHALGCAPSLESALDFGCGVGRLTRALAGRFQEVVGVDISEAMIDKARELNPSLAHVSFVVNVREDLGLFPDGRFGFVYSNIVLQHLPTRTMIFGYVGEFLRVLAPGGLLIFQLPGRLPPWIRLQPRRALFKGFRLLGMPERTLRVRFGLHPIRMQSVPRDDMLSFLKQMDGRVAHVDTVRDNRFGVDNCVYYVTRSGSNLIRPQSVPRIGNSSPLSP